MSNELILPTADSWSARMRVWLRNLFVGEPSERRRIPDLQPAFDHEPQEARPIGGSAPVIASGRSAVFSAFNTAMPVTDRHALAGRKGELARLVDAVVQQRKHALIFGARGSGKTSLARVFGDLADEAGCVALYGSASAEADVDALFRPFLAELPVHRGAIESLGATPLTVQQLANLFVQGVSQRTLLIIDEFDRVASDRTRHEVATLLKLLTDMHANVEVVLVGIAGNVEGLLAAHPSLRRHLFAQPVLPIERDELARLLRLCATRARFEIEEDALQTLVSAAIGSPYHARLFGMHAALIAERDGRDRIRLSDAQKGLSEALDEWSDLTPNLRDLFRRALDNAGPLRGMIALTGVLAAHAPILTANRLISAGTDLFGEDVGGLSSVERALDSISPALTDAGPVGEFQFEDTLAPQFLVLMANGAVRAPKADRLEAASARELLQGVIVQ